VSGRRALALASGVLAGAAAATTPARAQPAPGDGPALFSGSTAAVAEYRGDNRNGDDTDDRFADALVRTQLALDGGDTRAELRFDAEAFHGQPRGPGAPERRGDLRLERARIELERTFGRGRVEIAAGDFYAQVGRGLLLSLRRVDELGLDVALRGAKARLGWLDDAIAVELMGGTTNAVNVERQRLARVEDPEDRIGGGRLEGRAGGVLLGVHAVGARESEAGPLGGPDQSFAFGGGAEGTLGPVAFGVEVDRQHRRVAGQPLAGTAVYGTAGVTAGRITLLAEGKHYDRFAPLLSRRVVGGDGRLLLSLPPTAERIDQELLDNSDITGGRLRGDVVLDLETASSAHANLGVYRDRFLGQWFSHAFAGVDWRRPSQAAVAMAGGHRREWQWSGALVRAIAHGELDGYAPLSPRTSIHLAARYQLVTEGSGAARDRFHRGDSSIEVSWADRWTFGGGLDWDTQKRAPGVARLFPWASVRWRPGDRFILQALGGAQRGGVRCIAGACREQPPFTGARLDVTVRF
jgi:hypothetical protein